MVGLTGLVTYAAYSGLEPGLDPRPGFYYGYRLQPLALAVPVGVLVAVLAASTRRAVIPTWIVSAAWLLVFAGRLVSVTADTTGALLYLAEAAALGLAALTVGGDRQLMDDRQPARRVTIQGGVVTERLASSCRVVLATVLLLSAVLHENVIGTDPAIIGA